MAWYSFFIHTPITSTDSDVKNASKPFPLAVRKLRKEHLRMLKAVTVLLSNTAVTSIGKNNQLLTLVSLKRPTEMFVTCCYITFKLQNVLMDKLQKMN